MSTFNLFRGNHDETPFWRDETGFLFIFDASDGNPLHFTQKSTI